jgi:hypothetical protein
VTAMTDRIRFLDFCERIFWTIVASGLGALAAAPLIDLDAAQGALIAAMSGGINAVLVIARWRLAVLPDPGSLR